MAKTKKQAEVPPYKSHTVDEIDGPTKEMLQKLENFTPAPTPEQRKAAIQGGMSIQDALKIAQAKGRKMAGAAPNEGDDALIDQHPLVGYTCEVCSKVTHVDVREHIPTLRLCDECKAKMKAKISV